MNLNKLNKRLTLLTNIGVLAGIFLLVIELRQNQEILELDQKVTLLDSAHIDVLRFADWRAKFINDPETAKIFLDGTSGRELDDVASFRFNLLCNDLFWAAALMYERSVLLDRSDYEEATVQWVRQTIQETGISTCWEDLKDVFSLWGYGNFVEIVDNP